MCIRDRDSTIPNKIKDAKNKYDAITNKLNNGNYANKSDYLNNPFQLSNCQWCNTKIIGREQPDGNPSIGHRISRNSLVSYCLNERCFFSENNDGLPIVLVDEDIYKNPPTVLFATVDKFAQLAWSCLLYTSRCV